MHMICMDFGRKAFSGSRTNEIFPVIDDGSKRYRDVIPGDCYHEPYMPMGELEGEMKRMSFYGYRRDLKLLGVMARERVRDVTLIRHAYVLRRAGNGYRVETFCPDREAG